jgi:hypothetical protein
VTCFTACAAVLDLKDLPATREDDGGVSNDAQPDDAHPDGTSADGGAPEALCVAPHDLCDTFDDSPDLAIPSRWTSTTTVAGGLVGVVNDIVLSPPNSLRAFLPAADGGLAPRALVQRNFTGSFRGATCSFDARSQGGLTTLWTMQAANVSYAVEWLYDGASVAEIREVTASDGGALHENGTTFGFPHDEWHKVTIDVSATLVTFSVDGKVAITWGVTVPPMTGLNLVFGAVPYGGNFAVPAHNHFDNVVCDLHR